MPDLPLVSVLFVTYDRFPLLRKTVSTFIAHTRYPKLQLVVTDDGSPAKVQEEIRKLPFNDFVLGAKNRGLGANVNAGIARCEGPYILMLQDDWDCVATADYIGDAVRVMARNPHIGLIRYYGPAHQLDAAPGLSGADEVCLQISDQERRDNNPSRIYSDTPHIMSRAALNYLGPYREDCPMESCETDYCRRFDAQDAFKAALFPRYYNKSFVHTGEDQSHRTRSARYWVDEALQPVARILRRCPPAFQLGKLAVRSSVRALERLGIVR
jgi:GT2 family glycosyltransferase